MFSSKVFNIAIVTVLLFGINIEAQNISGTDCFNGTNGQYLCNNQGYNGFSYNTTSTANLNTVSCFGVYGYVPCYYQLPVNNATPNLRQYLFCNYTFPGCSICNDNLSCDSCYRGYYLFTYNVFQGYQNCNSCNDAIAGCQICQAQSVCNQCSSPYINYLGLCYTKDGNAVSGFTPFESEVAAATSIVMDVLTFLILIILSIAFICMFACKRNPNNHDLSMKDELVSRR